MLLECHWAHKEYREEKNIPYQASHISGGGRKSVEELIKYD